MRFRACLPLLLIAAALSTFSSCRKAEDEIRVYRLARPSPEPGRATAAAPAAPPQGGGGMPALPPDHPPVGGMTATAPNLPPDHPPIASATSASPPNVVQPLAGGAAVPEHWEAQPLAQMRQASFLVRGPDGTQADVSLITLGPATDVLANVNRWLAQIQQPALTSSQLAQVVQQHSGELGEISVVDLEGKPEQGDPKNDGRILAAIAKTSTGTAFFKMRGNSALVGAEKENFLKWVSTFRR